MIGCSERARWAIVMTFAIAMAWVESASVFYIRALVDRIEPYQAYFSTWPSLPTKHEAMEQQGVPER